MRFNEHVREMEQQEVDQEDRRKAEKLARKEERKRTREKAKEEANGGPPDEDMMALMGFGAFGGAAKA